MEKVNYLRILGGLMFVEHARVLGLLKMNLISSKGWKIESK
jgi:hypothetical protein